MKQPLPIITKPLTSSHEASGRYLMPSQISTSIHKSRKNECYKSIPSRSSLLMMRKHKVRTSHEA